VGLRAKREEVASIADVDVSSLSEYLSAEGVTMQPLFGVSEDRLHHEVSSYKAETGVELPDLTNYYKVEAPDERLDDIAEDLMRLDVVEAAYVKPPTEIPEMLNVMEPAHEEAPPSTPDFTSHQGYLETAPGGVDAIYALTRSGGGGQGVNVIDIEGAWRFTHEDLLQNQGGVVGGTQSTSIVWRNHGTAVVGVIGGDRNTKGITGICPDANVRAISIFGGTGSSGAIRQAADMLSPGDIILIELHRPGPRHNFAGRADQKGYIAIEWWPDDFDAIKYATNKGVLVVEAAGNGAEDLDDNIYSVRPSGFPSSWTNPFNRSNRDSGSIVVGAGAPPPGTHGRNHGPDRSRLGFSNYGSIVDAQGWGREVTTCGYGDLQGGSNEDVWYTDTFSGTSSASPIVVGSLGCVQGVLRAQGRSPMTPAKARQCLRSTGSSQQDAPGRPATQRIGNRPNIRQLIDCALPKLLKERIKDMRDTKIKDFRDVKLKDIRDIKRKDISDIKRKEIREFKEREIKPRELRELVPTAPAEAESMEERLSKIEGAVVDLAHFIGIELRPDLEESSLSQEPDLYTISKELEKEAKDAKNAKDNKDLEKIRET